MPAPPMMGASRAQFVKNSRLEIMTLSFMSARCHFESLAYTHGKLREKYWADVFFSGGIAFVVVSLKTHYQV
jgi:hypothetical protein